MSRITVKNDLLIWARERSGFAVDEFAKKLGVKAARVEAWEDTGTLTFGQIEKIAKLAKIPSGYLFLSERPTEEFGITDFRTVGNKPLRKPSRFLAKTILDLKNRQNWLSQYRRESGEKPVGFVGSISQETPVKEAANQIIRSLGIGRSLSKGESQVSTTILAHIKALESAGINVVKSGYCGTATKDTFDVEEFRGFALSDDYAPFIFINGADLAVAQLFTIVHEVVHIGLGVSGVESTDFSKSPANPIERFCNKVAAEILAPRQVVRALWNSEANSVEITKTIARNCKVSAQVVAIKLLHEGLIGYSEYKTLADNLKTDGRPRNSGGTYYNSIPYRLGRNFAEALFTSTAEGRTLFGDALRLSGIENAKTFQEVAKRMTGYEIFT